MATGVRKWLPGRATEAEAPGSDLSGVTSLDLVGVTLVTEVTGTRQEVGDLGLGFSERGMTVRRPDASPFVTIPWARIAALSADAETQRFGGLSTAVALEVQSDRQRHRFLVPHVTPEALTGSLGTLAGRYASAGIVSGGPRKRRH